MTYIDECNDCIVCCRLDVDHSLYDDLRSQYPDHLPLFKARLEALDNHKVHSDSSYCQTLAEFSS